MQASVSVDRQLWIGGSDIPSIMGISPFTNRWDMLLFKAGLKENDFSGNEFTIYGTKMEPVIRDFINNSVDSKYLESRYEYRATGIRCHLDGENKDTVLEIKTTSQIHDDVNEYKVYLVQLLFYMMNVGKKKGVLAVYKRPEDFSEDFKEDNLQIFNINIDDYKSLCDEITNEVNRFKEDVEKLKNNPLLTEEDFIPTDIVELSNKIVEIENELAMYKQIELKQKELKQKLYKAMLENNIKKWETPNGTKITLVQETEDTTVMEFNVDKFKEEQPLIYTNYCEEKIKKGKAGYIKITL